IARAPAVPPGSTALAAGYREAHVRIHALRRRGHRCRLHAGTPRRSTRATWPRRRAFAPAPALRRTRARDVHRERRPGNARPAERSRHRAHAAGDRTPPPERGDSRTTPAPEPAADRLPGAPSPMTAKGQFQVDFLRSVVANGGQLE